MSQGSHREVRDAARRDMDTPAARDWRAQFAQRVAGYARDVRYPVSDHIEEGSYAVGKPIPVPILDGLMALSNKYHFEKEDHDALLRAADAIWSRGEAQGREFEREITEEVLCELRARLDGVVDQGRPVHEAMEAPPPPER